MDCNFIRGWAWDKNNPNSVLTVELVEGTTVHATAIANIYRADLLNAGAGSTGKYAFSMALPASLKDGQAHQLSIRVKGSSHILSNSPRSVTCAALPPQFAGKFETADCNSVQGWAWASNYPDSSYTVELMEGSTVHATAVAKVYRADLKANGTGTGYYGFDIPLPSALKNGQARQLSVRIKGSTYVLPSSPITVTCAALPDYAGVLEGADCDLVRGWAWDKNNPNSILTVELVEGSTVYATATANTYRADLLSAGTGSTGNYGFSFALPAALKDGKSHNLSVRVKGTSYSLSGSPKTLSCAAASLYAGIFDSMDCNFIRGWAWDKNNPNSVLTVELVEGTTVHATAIANIYRADLLNAGAGSTGKYAFNMALPPSLKDGQEHQLSIRVKGSSHLLSKSPRTITCSSTLRTNAENEIATVDKQPDSELDLEMVLSPNPTSGLLTIRTKLRNKQQAELFLYDTRGSLIWKNSVVGSGEVYEQEVDLREQSTGTYLLKLQTRQQTKVKQVVLVR
jgi:hypothetical protein